MQYFNLCVQRSPQFATILSRRANEDSEVVTRSEFMVSGSPLMKTRFDKIIILMAAKKLSLEEVVELVTDNANDLHQNEEDKDIMEPDEVMESIVHHSGEADQNTDSIETLNTFNTTTAHAATIRRALDARIVSCASILHSESRLWLAMVNRRLSGRRKIRNPFNGELKRDLPCGVFKVLQWALKSSSLEEFNEPNCYRSENKKGAVISFTSLKSVTTLFTILSGYTEMEVKKFFYRSLMKSRGKAELIVSEVKDFALIYKYSKGQFYISFNFGVWNANGFPQHA